MTSAGTDDALQTALAAWLPKARWFPLKSQSLTSLDIVARVPLPTREEGGEFVVVDAITAGGGGAGGGEQERHTFVVPILWTTSGPIDASDNAGIARWLSEAAIQGDGVHTATSSLVGVPTAAHVTPWQAGHVSPLAANSSNTLLAIDEADAADEASVILKLLRQVRPGIQPEVEIGRLFAATGSWPQTPRLRGALEWHHPSRGVAVVAVLHDRVPHAASLWDHLLATLCRRSVSVSQRGWGDGELRATLAALGYVTAGMHRALAAETRDPAFGDEAWTPQLAAATSRAMTDHATSVFHAVTQAGARLPAAALLLLDEAMKHRDAWLARLASLTQTAWKSRRIRVHGDYHLGQVLIRQDAPERPLGERLFVIDFEGEPQRSLNERRQKHAAAKDVAGMLRSLDYLVRVAINEGAENLPHNAAEQLCGWFLGSYTAAAVGTCFWPTDPTEARCLLDIYCLDKAIYELAYEANNRPDWIEVPLKALLSMTP
jgi:maltose alpha-D-glucosyltransferase/alpha-amylase